MVPLIILVVYLLNSATKLDRSDVNAAVDATADELERTPVKGLGISSFDIWDAAARANRSDGGRYSRNVPSELSMESAGKDSRGDLYEFTNSDGDHPVCLVRVEIDLRDSSPAFPSTSVTDGPC